MTLHDGIEKLAWFHAATGLALGEQDYLVRVDRVTGATRARLGEETNWAAPNHVAPADPRLARLRIAYGNLPVHGVGSTEALERFRLRHPHLRNCQPPPPAPMADLGWTTALVPPTARR